MYRDDAHAARLRIETLEAKLAEQDAGRVAREAEIAELRASLERLGEDGGERKKKRRGRWPVLAVGGMAVLGAAAGVRAAARPLSPVLSCELYLTRLETCGGDPRVVAAYHQAGEQLREAIKVAGATAEGRAALDTACTEGLAGLNSSSVCDSTAPARR